MELILKMNNILSNATRYMFSSLPSPLVSAQFLKQHLNKVKVIDGSWYMPSMNRNAEHEYMKEHIPGALRFDIDTVCVKGIDLPHMIPPKEQFEEYFYLLSLL